MLTPVKLTNRELDLIRQIALNRYITAAPHTAYEAQHHHLLCIIYALQSLYPQVAAFEILPLRQSYESVDEE